MSHCFSTLVAACFLFITLVSAERVNDAKKSEFCFKTVNASGSTDSFFRLVSEIREPEDPVRTNPWKYIEGLEGMEYDAASKQMIGRAHGMRYLNETGYVNHLFVASMRDETEANKVDADEFSAQAPGNTINHVRAVAWDDQVFTGGEYYLSIADPSSFTFKMDGKPIDLEAVLIFSCNQTDEILALSAEEQLRIAKSQNRKPVDMVQHEPHTEIKISDPDLHSPNSEVCFRKNGLGTTNVHIPFYYSSPRNIAYYAKTSAFPTIFSTSIAGGTIMHLCFLKSDKPYVKVLATSYQGGKDHPITRPYVDFTEEGYTSLSSFVGIPSAYAFWNC
mmetsp:Transcript_3382/g.12855  ORF Transcript_3382/g.12855 Transcript_3382/m.12855 type:complete len:333 (-) Transcript_3382:4963-5961(-)